MPSFTLHNFFKIIKNLILLVINILMKFFETETISFRHIGKQLLTYFSYLSTFYISKILIMKGNNNIQLLLILCYTCEQYLMNYFCNSCFLSINLLSQESLK